MVARTNRRCKLNLSLRPTGITFSLSRVLSRSYLNLVVDLKCKLNWETFNLPNMTTWSWASGPEVRPGATLLGGDREARAALNSLLLPTCSG